MQYCRLLSLALALLSVPALAQSPEALDYFRTGYDLVKKGSFRNAVIELEKAVEADSTYGNAYYVLGISYKALNEYDKAIASFTAAHALGTKPEKAAKALAQLYKKAALNSFRQKKYNEVITYFTDSQKLGVLDAQSLYIMGLSYSGLREKDKAAMAYAEAITADPTDARPYNALGDIQRLNRDYGKSVVTYQRSIEADPTYMESYGDLARVKFNTDDIEGVVPLLQNALKIDDTYAEGHRLLGIALNQLGRFHEAIAPLNKAADLDKDYCETHYRLGEAHYGMGNFRQAVEYGRRATSCQADYRAAEVLLGDAHFQLGQRKEARRWYNLAVNDSRYKDYAASKLAEIDEQPQ
ncbi:MAG: tetratricopeptide repeat protein [Gemmatimonadetes bacterium]|nr:tetratricopeptide repeat protein [Gemmatimonadota bacterium]MYC70924.1 tetratricopeptide repeat protein [Gemmatimonadota bacterium]